MRLLARMPILLVFGLSGLFLSFLSCAGEKQADIMEQPQFKLLKKESTGLDFENVLFQSEDFHVFNYMYFFNGGGVASGDFNQDGLIDLYFTSNMGPNKLFLNEGNLHFRDVTIEANLQGMEGWTAGASVIDINQDGLLDIYVSQVGDYKIIKGKNQLYICQGIKDGIPYFKDEAESYKLDFIGFSTQAVFFDFDLDGDLDLFQLCHSLHQNGTFGQRKSFLGTQHKESGDKLYRNDNGIFTDVTKEAGINSTVIGYGLGVVTGDVDNDGWPDIYVGNDFHENDYLYINQKNGTFKECLTEQMMHTSRFSMGVDMADINNDAFSEIISLDMLPDDPFILKSSLGEDDYGLFNFKLGYGYNHQYARNNLQLNNQDNTFSEIGMYAGVFATDWSWAPLFFDFDDDGYKDIFISNGIPRRMNDIDYVNFRKSNSDIKWKTQLDNLEKTDLSIVEKMPRIKLNNRIYRNNGNLTFSDVATAIQGDLPSFSNGSVMADLDNDGDLDLVVNNLEDEPFLYQNLTIHGSENHSKGAHLTLNFKGTEKNQNAIGATILVDRKDGTRIKYENYYVRGYQSSMAGPLHVGLGDTNQVAQCTVIWPDQTFETFVPAFNKPQTLSWRANLPTFDYSVFHLQDPPVENFQDITQAAKLDFLHKENPFVEFHRETLIPFMVSAEGPALAIGDVNGDGLDDVFLGNSKRQKSKLLVQVPDGSFRDASPQSFTRDSLFEDVDAVFADLDQDGDLDLVVASGGNEFTNKAEAQQQRIYFNDEGSFERSTFIKDLYMTAACVIANDFNGDGMVDLFFGGRAVPWNYGIIPESYLMLNKGKGAFENASMTLGKALQKAGLIRNGVAGDINGDFRPDIILALEWAPVTAFLNLPDGFKKLELGVEKGWWNFVYLEDLDQDGNQDVLVGNTGLNNKFRPTKSTPLKLYVNDFDDNGQIEQILSYQIHGKEIPFATYMELTKQLVSLKKNYLYSKDLAKASMSELFGEDKLADAHTLSVDEFQNGVYFNRGNSKFEWKPLPMKLQFSPQKAAAHLAKSEDEVSMVIGGNFYENNIEMGRYDADYGHILTIRRDGSMQVSPLGKLRVKGQIRRIRPIRIGKAEGFVLARNDDSAVLIERVSTPENEPLSKNE